MGSDPCSNKTRIISLSPLREATCNNVSPLLPSGERKILSFDSDSSNAFELSSEKEFEESEGVKFEVRIRVTELISEIMQAV